VNDMTDTELWIRRFHPADDAATQLLCLPHAGGSASYFFPVSRSLAPVIDVLAVQYPGRQDRLREPGLTSVQEMADRLVAAIMPLTGRPITLFGHSLGASVGYEVARRLERAGVRPTGLFASGRRAPHRNWDDGTHLRDDAGLIADVRALAGTETAVLDDEDVLSMVLPAIRSDYTAAETYTYRPGPRLSCPIYALTGSADPKVTLEEADGWRDHTDADFDLVVMDGGHFFVNDHVPDILRRIKSHVRAVRSAAVKPANIGRL
jgi:pyochelin biosynthetic protein PchC